MLRLVFSLLLVVGLTSTPVLGQSLPLPSMWKNQRGSEMKLWAGGTSGSLSGEYINNAAGFDCRGMPFALSGSHAGPQIRFVVVWKNVTKSCNSLAAWRGRIMRDKIYSTWELAYVDAATGTVKILRGSDVFDRTN